ncbi:MAG: aminotransferase class I/II-fold pyridoxal phosphate-dependent enzyme [Thiotrichales bacterium]|nr:aminotransferase class I/II-fold pyridoxal phosphate-dependent enzyme [Thiotrichales bacterium]
MPQDLPISKTAQAVQPFHVMKILGEAKALQAQGKDIIHLEIGEPDFASLNCVHEAVNQAMQAGLTHYTPTLGLAELRQKLSDFYQRFYQASVPPAEIMLTPGSSSGLQLLLTALLNPGDKVLLTDPSYPCNRQFVKLLHGQVVSVPVDASTTHQLTTDLLKTHWQTGIKLVMVASPANPTGSVIEQSELVKMAQFLSEQNAYLLVDEIYQGLVYDRPAESILANQNLGENVLVINSFSKFFGMTGWRLGWLVAPLHLMPVLDRLGQNLFLAAPTLAQYGALRVLEPDALALLEQRRQAFQIRRATLINAMHRAGWTINQPQGAFYIYWDVSNLTEDAEQLAMDILWNAGVAVTPGKDFGDYKAKQHLRLAYTTEPARLEEAVNRIVTYLSTR